MGKSDEVARLGAIADLAALLAVGWREPDSALASGLVDGTWVADVRSCCREIGAGAEAARAVHAIALGYGGKPRPESDEEPAERDQSAACDGTVIPSGVSGPGPDSAVAAEGMLDRLRMDHTALFDVPRQSPASLYESHYMEYKRDRRPGAAGKLGATKKSGKLGPLFISRTAAAVRLLYSEAGVQAPASEPPDHIAQQLEFVDYCARMQSTGLGDVNWQELRARIGCEHLAVWVPRMAHDVQSAAQTVFYSELAGLTAALVEPGLLWSDAASGGIRGRLRILGG